MLKFPTRPTHASPSVAIEKGAYRLRHPSAPRLRTPSKLRPASSGYLASRSVSSSSQTETARAHVTYEQRMALSLVGLALCSLGCFLSAWVLWTVGKQNAGRPGPR